MPSVGGECSDSLTELCPNQGKGVFYIPTLFVKDIRHELVFGPSIEKFHGTGMIEGLL